MNTGFSKFSRTTMVALAMAMAGTSISFAAPYGAAVAVPAIAGVETSTLPVVDVDWRNRRVIRNHSPDYDRSGWDRGSRHHHGDWDRDHWRHGRRHFDNGSFYGGAALGLGLGLLAAPTYDYYAPRRVYVEPRRVYRSVGGSHTQWCYNRYRSYRAYDNTFQPYNGPRQQCYSPYS